ncbi:YMGG-like glycine zipper-containing protein [Aquabacterium sp.]|uniref:YMGG-like glycine zipper-containing protein n=1 Tax=Aquabacterium sp. TaxID=1872578 RepID=UPI003782DD94
MSADALNPPRSQRLWLLAPLLCAALSGCVVAPAHRPVYSAEGRRAPPPVVEEAPMYFYPERGQPDELQSRDRYECYRWAAQQTNTDPGMTPVRQVRGPTIMPPVRDGADVVAGAATGAVLGAAVSSPRHAGENAVIGAIFGTFLGALAQESRAQAIEQAQARQQQAAAASRVPTDNFRRAMAACMQGRGYRIG